MDVNEILETLTKEQREELFLEIQKNTPTRIASVVICNELYVTRYGLKGNRSFSISSLEGGHHYCLHHPTKDFFEGEYSVKDLNMPYILSKAGWKLQSRSESRWFFAESDEGEDIYVLGEIYALSKEVPREMLDDEIPELSRFIKMVKDYYSFVEKQQESNTPSLSLVPQEGSEGEEEDE